MVSIDDMNFATGICILLAINAIISLPLALITAAIIFAFRKKHGDSFGEIFGPTIGIYAGTLTVAYVIYNIVMYFRG